MPKVSIMIRAKNEERWIGHCLKMIHKQSYTDWEIVLIDNQSTDATVDIARRNGVTKVVPIDKYLPGDALNRGIAGAEGEYIVCLSAHCVPKDIDWLGNLVNNFNEERIAGVYGRQIPTSFSQSPDKRDLLITFGLEKRAQTKDYFFHNGNSAIRRELWVRFPFDGKATNIEDRIWAKLMVDNNYQLIYEPEAVVYHHHGIHQGMDRSRSRNTVQVLSHLENEDDINSLPESMKPENIYVSAVSPVLRQKRSVSESDINRLKRLIHDLKASKFVNSIHIISDHSIDRRIAAEESVYFIERPKFLYPPDKTLEDALNYSLLKIEDSGIHPDVVLYANFLFPKRPKHFFDDLIMDIQYKGLDTVFGGFRSYSNYWIEDEDEEYKLIGEGFKPRSVRRPIYEALHGLGTAISTAQLRKKGMIGGRVGIIPITDPSYRNKIQ